MDTVVRQVIFTVVVSVGLVFSEAPLNNQYGVPGNFGGHGNHGGQTNSYGGSLEEGHDANQDYIDSQPKSYEFGYAVKDVATGNDFGRQETSDGETVRGEYRVQLPDGRTQIVTYTADWRNGFHADVRYEGVASYPEQYNTNDNNNHNNNNNNRYNNAGTNYDFHGNSVDSGYNGGNNGGYNNDYHSNGGNYNSGHNSNNFGSSTLDNGYPGFASNTFGTKSPSSTYGTPAFH